jgi:hypothetical protein
MCNALRYTQVHRAVLPDFGHKNNINGHISCQVGHKMAKTWPQCYLPHRIEGARSYIGIAALEAQRSY